MSRKSEYTYNNVKTTLCVFKAIEELSCFECQKIIESGDIFSRSADKKGTVQGLRYIFCIDCRPVEIVETDNQPIRIKGKDLIQNIPDILQL